MKIKLSMAKAAFSFQPPFSFNDDGASWRVDGKMELITENELEWEVVVEKRAE